MSCVYLNHFVVLKPVFDDIHHDVKFYVFNEIAIMIDLNRGTKTT